MTDKEVYDDIIYDNEYDDIIFEGGNVIIQDKEQDEFTDNYLPDHWISEQYDIIYEMYCDIRHQGYYTSLCDNLKFSQLCEFIEEMHYNSYYYRDTCNWCTNIVREYAYKSSKLRPKFKQWSQHFLIELFDLFMYLNNLYTYDLGGFEVFMDFAYRYSSSNLVIKN